MTNRSLPCSTNDPSTVPTKRVINRSLPYYTCDRKNPHHEAARKIWQADTLSCDPCAVCKALKIDCWVDGEYSSCARCTASQQHEGICNAVGTKDAHQDLEEPSSLRQQEHGNPTSDQPDEDNTSIGITSATSNDMGSNTQRPAPCPNYIDEREQPDYAIPSRTYTHVTAHKIWLAKRLSTDPCKACQDAELGCWVESKHVACARCTSFQRTAKQCGAKGTKFNPVDRGGNTSDLIQIAKRQAPQRLKRKIGAAQDGKYEADDDFDEEIEHNAGGDESDDEYDGSSFASAYQGRGARRSERRITRSSRQQARQLVASSNRNSDSESSLTSAAKFNQGDQQQASDMKACVATDKMNSLGNSTASSRSIPSPSPSVVVPPVTIPEIHARQTQLSSRMEQYEARIEGLESNIADRGELESHIDQFNSKIKELTSAIEQLDGKFDQFIEVEELKGLLKARDDRIRGLEENSQDLKKRTRALEASTKALNARLSTLELPAPAAKKQKREHYPSTEYEAW
ncbi:hypothetical protein G7Y79_00071g097060 [Physcia stellaris]|nr:hypothetical protein G7Y79_00071g097060 [Physcia stellaris]